MLPSILAQLRASAAPRVFLLIGQSNMVGRGPFDGGAGYPSGAYEYTRAGQIIPAAPPLDHEDAQAGQMGLALQNAIDFRAANPASEIIFVPRARGGSSLASGAWQVGGSRYNEAVSSANAALAASGGVLAGIFDQHGEADSNLNNTNFAAQKDAQLVGLRSEITGAANVPIVLGRMLPSWVAGAPIRQTIDGIIADTPNRLSGVAVADATGLTGVDEVHFDAASLRTLGSRYFVAWSNLSGSLPAPQAVGTIPDQTDPLPAPQAIGTIPDQTDTT